MFSLLFVFLSWGSVSEETTSYLILSKLILLKILDRERKISECIANHELRLVQDYSAHPN